MITDDFVAATMRDCRALKPSPPPDTLDEQHWARIDRLYQQYLVIEEMKREQMDNDY